MQALGKANPNDCVEFIAEIRVKKSEKVREMV